MIRWTMHQTIVRLGAISFCTLSAVAQSAPPADIPGYVHDLSRSKFNIGDNPIIEVDTTQLRRWRGTAGAWALEPANGWSMGILDGTAPTGPYILDETIQGERVKQYFVRAGLPADQVRDVRATFQVLGGAPLGASPQSATVELLSINSILTRNVQGIPVAESLAWAKMTVSGGVDMECVFWPTLDGAVVARALALAQKMTDPQMHAAFLAKLPGTIYRDGGVVIHHTDASVHATPATYVSYDVTLSSAGHAPMRHFDENGHEFQLPQEQATPPLKPPVLHPKGPMQ
jgi:hypothetical protein